MLKNKLNYLSSGKAKAYIAVFLPVVFLSAQSSSTGDLMNAVSVRTLHYTLAYRFVIGIVILAVLAFIITLLKRIIKKAGRIRNSGIRMLDLARKRAFEPNEIRTAELLCSHYDIKEKDLLLLDRAVFNDAAEKFINTELPGLDIATRTACYQALHSMRIKNKFYKPPAHMTLITTKEIEINQKLLLRIANREFPVIVLENLEEYLIITPPKFKGRSVLIPKGREVVISFWRPGDGHYRIKTSVVNTMPVPMLAICLAHTSIFSKSIKRKYERADFRLGCTFLLVDKEFFKSGASRHYEVKNGTILNISAGGLNFVSPVNIEKSSYVSMSFSFDKKFIINDLRGKVLKKMQVSTAIFKYHIEYIGISENLQKKIANRVRRRNLETENV